MDICFAIFIENDVLPGVVILRPNVLMNYLTFVFQDSYDDDDYSISSMEDDYALPLPAARRYLSFFDWYRTAI